jgi:ketosteroid isomerase-like protein
MACAVAFAAPVGCGGDDESAEDVAQEYVDARNDGDAAKVCELYSDELKVQAGAGENCEAFIEEQSSGADTEFTLIEVEENGDRATAELRATPEQQAPVPLNVPLTITLEREDGDWLITDLGPSTGD